MYVCVLVGFWSLICVGLFAHADPTQEMIVERNGLLRGGNYELLAVQIVYGLACTIWAATSTYVILKVHLHIMLLIDFSNWKNQMDKLF